MKAVVEQCSIDKKYFDIQKKEIFLDNDRLLEHIICQDVMKIVMHADYVSISMLPVNNKRLLHDNVEIERLEKENANLFELLLSQDIVYICVNSFATLTNYAKMVQDYIDEYNKNLVLKAKKYKHCLDSRKEFKKRLMEIQRKEIKRPEALDIEKFAALYEGIALQNLNHFTFRDNIVDLENVDTMVFQLGREKRSMTMRQFIMVGTVGKKRQRGYKKKSPIVRTHLIGKIARLFVLMTPGALRGVTLVLETSFLSVAKLVELGICKYNALGYGVIVDYVPEVAGDEVAGAGMGQADVRGVRCHPKITTTNRLRAMDERLGDIKTDISRLVSDIDELTYVVSGMFEQYDQFYREFGQWRIKQESFQTWKTNHLS
ncbi:hypothetical protein Tco_0191539 [Tanacetum coccineum]